MFDKIVLLLHCLICFIWHDKYSQLLFIKSLSSEYVNVDLRSRRVELILNLRYKPNHLTEGLIFERNWEYIRRCFRIYNDSLQPYQQFGWRWLTSNKGVGMGLKYSFLKHLIWTRVFANSISDCKVIKYLYY